MSHSLYSPMEQFSNFPLLSLGLTITNSSLFLLLAALLLSSLLYLVLHRTPLIHNNWQILVESLYHTTLNMVVSFIGKNHSVYFPLIFSTFFLILFSNFIGLIPYCSTPTVEIVLTLALAFTLLFGILLLGALSHKILLLATFLPAGTPLLLVPLMVLLELIAYLSRTLSLGLRLAINLITGHILAKVGVSFIWAGYSNGSHFLILLIPILLLTLYLALEILIAYLQSYIFVFITCLTFKDMS